MRQRERTGERHRRAGEEGRAEGPEERRGAAGGESGCVCVCVDGDSVHCDCHSHEAECSSGVLSHADPQPNPSGLILLFAPSSRRWSNRLHNLPPALLFAGRRTCAHTSARARASDRRREGEEEKQREKASSPPAVGSTVYEKCRTRRWRKRNLGFEGGGAHGGAAFLSSINGGLGKARAIRGKIPLESSVDSKYARYICPSVGNNTKAF